MLHAVRVVPDRCSTIGRRNVAGAIAPERRAFSPADLGLLSRVGAACTCLQGLGEREQQVNLEYPNLEERRRATDDPGARTVARDDRPRDAWGHCWDGRPCDHPGHGAYRADYGIIHLIH